jgi:hypothetical protein
MNGAKPASKPEQTELGVAQPASGAGHSVGPGLGRLLHGDNHERMAPGPALEQTSQPDASTSISRSLFWTLLAADALLLVLASCLLITGRSRPDLLVVILAVMAVALGAWLSCYAVWSRGPGRPNESFPPE